MYCVIRAVDLPPYIYIIRIFTCNFPCTVGATKTNKCLHKSSYRLGWLNQEASPTLNMADKVPDISVDSAEREGAGDDDEKNRPQVEYPVEVSASQDTSDDRAGVPSANDTPEAKPPPNSTSAMEQHLVTPSIPTEEAETKGQASTGRRVSFQVGWGGGGGENEPTQLANRDSMLAPPAFYRRTPSAATSTSSLLPLTPEPSSDNQRHGRRRDSEWVFRPLKLKFKVKELEELYRTYVYRQQLSLVFTACSIMVALSVIVFISFLVNTKVHVYVLARRVCFVTGRTCMLYQC